MTQGKPDPDRPEVEFLDPRAWGGPPSRMVTEILNRDLTGPDATMAIALLYQILRKDTLRVLMDMSDFWPIFERTAAGGSAGFRKDAKWPHRGPIYMELPEALPDNPREYLGVVHGFVIADGTGDDTRGVVIPGTRKGQVRALGVTLNIKTGEVMNDNGPEFTVNQLTDRIRGLALFLADANNEIVEMTLSRRAVRRLRRSGAPNPWHVVRRRGGTGPR